MNSESVKIVFYPYFFDLYIRFYAEEHNYSIYLEDNDKG